MFPRKSSRASGFRHSLPERRTDRGTRQPTPSTLIATIHAWCFVWPCRTFWQNNPASTANCRYGIGLRNSRPVARHHATTTSGQYRGSQTVGRLDSLSEQVARVELVTQPTARKRRSACSQVSPGSACFSMYSREPAGGSTGFLALPFLGLGSSLGEKVKIRWVTFRPVLRWS